jgi:hypothetical protein
LVRSPFVGIWIPNLLCTAFWVSLHLPLDGFQLGSSHTSYLSDGSLNWRSLGVVQSQVYYGPGLRKVLDTMIAKPIEILYLSLDLYAILRSVVAASLTVSGVLPHPPEPPCWNANLYTLGHLYHRPQQGQARGFDANDQLPGWLLIRS